ncbi:MAG: peptidoglycan D,D-transpeptidase FtsI family protein [Solirubrobacterales bacterium]
MRLIDRRLGILFVGFALLFSVALARAAWLQGVRGGALAADAHSQQTEKLVVPGRRGRVLDRTGKVLAVSEDAADVTATPYQVPDPDATATRLAPLVGVPAGELADKLADRSSGFAYLARKVDLRAAQQIRDMEIPGIQLIPDSRRIYPQGELASQLIGAVGVDNQGLTGLEQGEEDTVGGQNGEQEIVRDATGAPIRLEQVRPATTGQDLRLTIDAAIQSKTEDALQEVADTYDPIGATAIVIDPKSSDVLAMANWPPFDPSDLSAATEEELTNRATNYTYEPGSTFKAFTVAAGLEDRKVTPQTSFYLPPEIKIYDRTIGEAEGRGPIDLDVSQILAQSSNVGAVKIGLAVGADSFDRWIRAFGFGRATGVGYPGEEKGIVPARDDYSGSTMGNLPIGQGLAVTPMQMVEAYSAIANGGILRPPRILEQVGADPVAQKPGSRVITRRVSEQLRRMLEGVLEPGGTAASVSVPGYTLAGKTGTAQKVNDDGTYSESRYVASFVGFAPARDPGLLVAVMVDEPKVVHVGAEVAAPAFGDIAQFALPYLGISPN